MSIYLIAFLLFGGHFVADYPLQSEFIAWGKNRHRSPDPLSIPPGQTPQTIWPWVLTSHAFTHAVVVALITQSVVLGVAELVCHWLIDFGKCENWYGIHTDQSLHLICKAWWLVILILWI